MAQSDKKHRIRKDNVQNLGGKTIKHVVKNHHLLSEELKSIVGMGYGSFFRDFPVFGKKNKLLQRLFLYFFQLFEKRYGARLYIELPEKLRNIKPELWQLGRIISKLQKEKILSYVEPLPNRHDEPPLFRYQSVIPGEKGSFSPFYGIGHSFFSEGEALITSIGEAIERYCYRHFIPDSSITLRASYEELKGSAIDPLSVVGISEEIRKKNTNPRFRSFSQETKFTWTQGRSLTYEKTTWFPLQLISANPIIDRELEKAEEPLIRQSVSTGAAVGKTKNDAIYRGICEVVERDAFMLTYLNRFSPPRILLEELSEERFSIIKRQLEKYSLDLFLLYLPTDFPLHVVMAYIMPKEKQSPYFALGFKTDLDLETACYGAIKEALNSRIAYRFMLEHTDDIIVPDPSDTEQINQFERVHMWQTNPGFLSQIEFLIKGSDLKVSELPFFSAAQGSFQEKLEFLISHLKEQDIEAIYIENSTKNLAKACKEGGFSFRSFFVIIPSLQPMHLHESMACFSGKRIKTVPDKLGFKVDPSIINTFPHPIP